ncbi:MAG: prolyl aminopeptidase [Chloroflexota bacterium]|nr:prolyl aminopeptidase [Chloroflexota bacterium]
MTERYPAIEPYDRGMLDVGDGNSIYWETCGNPAGRPAVVLHGGPGSGCSPGSRRLFNPATYRVVLFDQRGCGRSTPHASDPAVSLTTNTTHHLIADIERLRRHLGIERWLVFGGSWGTTLGLAYAEQHPAHVSAAILVSVVTTTRREVEWVTRDMGRIFPEEWRRFREAVPAAERNGSLVDAYSRLLEGPDPAAREQAAKSWCAWEDVHVSLQPGFKPHAKYNDAIFRYTFARLVTHYWRHAAWIEDGALIRDAAKLAGIPGVLIHGRLDISGPADIPWNIAQRWPGSELILLEGAGHGGGSGMTEAILTATERLSE